MQQALGASAGLNLSCPNAQPVSRRVSCPPSCSGRVMLPTCRRTYPVLRAVRDEDAELDRITREANQADIWDNEVIGVGVKVGLVAVLIAAVVFIGQLSGPIIDNTVKSFPSPSAYEAYEESK